MWINISLKATKRSRKSIKELGREERKKEEREKKRKKEEKRGGGGGRGVEGGQPILNHLLPVCERL